MAKGDTFIWLCYDCRKFICTKCYSKDHKRCYADLIENMYEEIKNTNEGNLESVKGMREEFAEEVEFMVKKYDYFDSNNPFDMNIALVNKIYDNIISLITDKRDETLKTMNGLKDNYQKNVMQNIDKIKNMIARSKSTEAKLQAELKSMAKKTPFDFCRELLDSNVNGDLTDECSDIAVFQRQEFTRIKNNSIDTNTIVFNDTNAVIEQCKNLREYMTEKIGNFHSNYDKYRSKYAFTVIMNMKEFIVYLIDRHEINKVTYMNEFVIPCYARWINISGEKLILTGGEKDYIESLNQTYMFRFRKYEAPEIGFSAKVFNKAEMLYRRRAHSLIYFNDFM